MKPTYESPLASRYASKYMLHLFSDDSRYQTWRRLWTALARAQCQLGLSITEAQVAELEAHITDIDYDVAAQREREVRHDVMAHIYAYGKAAPSAAGILLLSHAECGELLFKLEHDALAAFHRLDVAMYLACHLVAYKLVDACHFDAVHVCIFEIFLCYHFVHSVLGFKGMFYCQVQTMSARQFFRVVKSTVFS